MSSFHRIKQFAVAALGVVLAASPFAQAQTTTTVYASGISPVTAWDPIIPAVAYPDWTAEAKPIPAVGLNANWVNPHTASVFPKGTHPWEGIVPYNFDANWINAWSNIQSKGPSGQNWTKYSTTVTGEGDFVLQFLADNASWIYIDGTLIGYQDLNWQRNGTGRYTIRLSGTGPHELSFIILDGGGAAGGKFRLETTQSFINNGGGTLPPPPPTPTDTTAPVISAPGNITAEATGPTGKVVTFSATAVDNIDGAVLVTASPASGSTFPIGKTAVGLAASDAAHNTATGSFDVTVRDTTPPAIVAPANVTTEATSPAGAAVSFTATASDLVDGTVAVTASPASGATFPLGVSTVTLSATDSRTNQASATFTVTVKDTVKPVLTLPGNQVLEATSAAGATATFAATATDVADAAPRITYSKNPGTVFPIGTTTVTTTATDASSNAAQGTFTVTVRDTTAPVVTAPANQTLEATSAAGATATFAATATDAVGPVTFSATPASGSTFALGTTTVTVTATDAYTNAASTTFTVTVKDTTAPVLTLPSNQILEATSAAGAVATFAASATDAVTASPALTYSKASGSTFALGVNTVTVTATDAAGNAKSGSFTITVRDTTAPAPTASLVNISKGGDDESSQFFRVVFAATDKVGVTVLTATLNGVTVTNGQIVQLQQIKSGAQSTKRDDGRLQIKATSFLLTVTATDAAANKGTATATAVFIKKGKDDDDKKGDDKKGDDKKDDDKKDDDKDDDRKKS